MKKDSFQKIQTQRLLTRFSRAFWKENLHFMQTVPGKRAESKEGTDNIDNFTVTYVPGNGDRKSTDMVAGLSSGWYISRKCWEDEKKRDAAVDLIETFYQR